MFARTPAAETLTELILTLFRVNNATLVWGDRLVQPFGLTSARWQIMGAVAYAGQPRSVAWLARDLGANRQNVQRIVNDLARDGLVTFATNPDHKRAQLVVLSTAGKHAYDDAIQAWDLAANELARGLSLDELNAALRTLSTLRDRLATSKTGEDADA